MALGFMMTTRGIPSIYYGTEIGLKNFADPDGKVRQDFPGGWPGDASNKFTAAGRSADEEAIFSHIRALARYRKSNPDLFKGDLIHFVPEKGIYVYFRQGGGKTLMCIFNPQGEQTLALDRFRGMLGEVVSGRDILGDFDVELGDQLQIPAKKLWLIELN
jgi:glycosidase